jgi:hypothetical protein
VQIDNKTIEIEITFSDDKITIYSEKEIEYPESAYKESNNSFLNIKQFSLQLNDINSINQNESKDFYIIFNQSLENALDLMRKLEEDCNDYEDENIEDCLSALNNCEKSGLSDHMPCIFL